MFDKNLQDLVRGIRNHKEDEVSEGPPAAPRGGTASSPAPPLAVPRLPAGAAPPRGEGGRRRPEARCPQPGLREAQRPAAPREGAAALGKERAGIKTRKDGAGWWQNGEAGGEGSEREAM